MRAHRVCGIRIDSLFSLVLALLLSACGGPGANPGAAAEPPVGNVYNWSDYIDPALLERFSTETGLKVNYDTGVPRISWTRGYGSSREPDRCPLSRRSTPSVPEGSTEISTPSSDWTA